LPSKHTKIVPVVSVMGLAPKNCVTNASKICQCFRFGLGLHPYKLATLRATIGLIMTSCYRIKLIKGLVTSQKNFCPAINFLMWKWPATLKRLGRP